MARVTCSRLSTPFKGSMENEYFEIKRYESNDLVKKRVKALFYMNNIFIGNSYRKKRVRQHFKVKKNESNVYLQTLEEAYNIVRKQLDSKYRFETIQTFHEQSLAKFLNLNQVKTIRSIWIGRRNIDLYLPDYGFAIEVNGPIHHQERKMKKDTSRDLFFNNNQIPIMEIENQDIRKRKYFLLSNLKYEKKLNLREREKRALNIYAITVATYCDWSWIENFFGYNLRGLDEI
jgi:very-short-patch-repair endonuclease